MYKKGATVFPSLLLRIGKLVALTIDGLFALQIEGIVSIGHQALLVGLHGLGCEAKDAIPEMNALLQRILPLRPLRDCGVTEADFKAFPQSVEANQQRLMTNAYYPFDLESEEAIYRKCY